MAVSISDHRRTFPRNNFAKEDVISSRDNFAEEIVH